MTTVPKGSIAGTMTLPDTDVVLEFHIDVNGNIHSVFHGDVSSSNDAAWAGHKMLTDLAATYRDALAEKRCVDCGIVVYVPDDHATCDRGLHCEDCGRDCRLCQRARVDDDAHDRRYNGPNGPGRYGN